MFHVELKQTTRNGRRFNLSREQLDAQFLRPWVEDRVIVIDELRFEPAKAKLKILEGPELRPELMGIGRGWQNAERQSEDATARLLDEAHTGGPGAVSIAEFKAEVQGACALDPRPLSDIVRLAGVRHPGARASDQLALAERAVWELLHQQRLELLEGSQPVPPERWEALVLAWSSWAGPKDEQPRVGVPTS